MKKIFYITFVILIFTFAAFAQDEQPNQADQPKRPKLMETLGLSAEQVQSIRKINQTQKPKMDIAQRKFRQARKALDDAIYAEEFSETEVETKTKELEIAQANVTKVKTETEVLIRKVLTAEQLVKFRELRLRMIPANMKKNRKALMNRKNMPIIRQ